MLGASQIKLMVGGGVVSNYDPLDVTQYTEAEIHAAVEAAARAAAGTWLLMRGTESLRTAVDVLPPETEPLARITRRVKAALDPHGILNPGRMYAGL